MKKFFSRAYSLAIWAAAALLFPFAVTAFFFRPIYIAAGAAVFIFLKFLAPGIVRRPGTPSLPASILVTEIALIFLLGIYYTSDRRPEECGFELDKRLAPILTYRQCMDGSMTPDRREACLKIVDNPYDMAIFGDELLVVSGRDFSVLGRLDPRRPGDFSAVALGYGNVQQIVPFEELGRVVMTMWKARKIIVFDMDTNRPANIFETEVSKLVGAEKHGGKVYVNSELPWMYVVDPKQGTISRDKLDFRFHTLYDMKISTAGDIYLTDWVWGLVYRLDAEKLEKHAERFTGIVATGMALDEEGCELYVSRPLYSKVEVVDCKTLERQRILDSGFSTHEIALSLDKKILYAVRYFTGTFREMDAGTGAVKDEFRVGGQTRALLRSGKSGRIFVASKCGIYEVLHR